MPHETRNRVDGIRVVAEDDEEGDTGSASGSETGSSSGTEHYIDAAELRNP
jgi:hypothetical protein